MNVVPLNATTPAAATNLAELTASAPARSKPLTGAALRNAAPDVQRREVAAQFEAILVRQLLKPTMTSMLGDEGAASGVYGDMLTDTFAQQLTRGNGLGLGRLLEQQLTPRVPSAALNATAAAAKPLSS
ncbi:MAG TPA: rod-binding protein [Opitutus sp.]|nr:rod-binding protein [Opitutus sp.]